MALSIDGPNKIISLDTTTVNYSTEEIYSFWKDWAISSPANAGIREAFRPVGGDPVPGGTPVPFFAFLRNDYGWRIKKPEADIDVNIDGNLLKQDSNLDLEIPPNGDFSPTITINRTNVGSAATAEEIVELMFSRLIEGSENLEDMMRLFRAALVGKASGAATTQMRFRDKADSKDRITATVDEFGNRSTVVTDATD